MSSYENDISSAILSSTRNPLIKAKHAGASSNVLDSSQSSLDATDDARKLVRILQCSQCSFPLENPMILPCGNTLCKRCLPECHTRSNISYPVLTAERRLGFTCPFAECRLEHALGDCSLDVVLAKLMDVIRTNISDFRGQVNDAPILLEEKDKWAIAGVSSLSQSSGRSVVLEGGRLVATYTMAENGELSYDSEVVYTNIAAGVGDGGRVLDAAVLEHLKEATRTELDCQVCYGLFLDPLTTPCGHTFCRKCLRRVFDHSTACPICRRGLRISPAVLESDLPSNKRLATLLSSLCPDALATRVEQVLAEEMHSLTELDTSLFVCGMSFPYMSTFLHIFEPRYRLMVRRALEADGCFGMLLHNPRQSSQGELGRVHFYQYGTLMRITNFQQFPDGRSLIETVGVSRFKVIKHGTLDAYQVGKVERIDDVSLAEEEALEASETAPSLSNDSATDTSANLPLRNPPNILDLSNLDKMSTQQLMKYCVLYVRKMKDASAPWMQGAFLLSHGDCPDDPILFPWWFASILPIVEMEKYRLMDTRTVRARLKICAGWIMRIKAQKWSQVSRSGCNVI